MYFIADLHIHSHYSRATSGDLNFPNLYRAALLKGIHIVGTGDFTHPGWIAEMEECLTPAPEQGFYRLKENLASGIEATLPPGLRHPVRFLLSAEVSSIYKKGNRTRKVHNIIFAPGIETAKKVNERLSKIGNLKSDGRPILGLDCRHLLEILLQIDEGIYLIPAHIWTPWFSILGAQSGFDDVRECFEDLSGHIFALETGLSSDPAMNRLCSRLDDFVLISNSDAHSAGKLGREASLFNAEFSYAGLFQALISNDADKFLGTIEFYPEEGKYHLSGHRKCEVRQTPEETSRHEGKCPVCGKPVTIGVMHRVILLSDRRAGIQPPKGRPFQTLVSLDTVLSEVLGAGPQSRKVAETYHSLLARLGPELHILQNAPLEALGHIPLLAEGMRRMREGRLKIEAGYDGEFGKICIFAEGEREILKSQDTFFFLSEGEGKPIERISPAEKARKIEPLPCPPPLTNMSPDVSETPNPEQEEAIRHRGSPLIVIAGPGTGKTRTLTLWIARLVEEGGDPASVLAITFTNKAAREMRERLAQTIGAKARQLTICTFHRLGLQILSEYGSYLGIAEHMPIYEAEDLRDILREEFSTEVLNAISRAKATLEEPQNLSVDLRAAYSRYQQVLERYKGVDLEDLIVLPVRLLMSHREVREIWQRRFRVVAVDEYQDLNCAQYTLLKLISGPATHLCVIGDPDQAIYGFRRADLKYFLRFSEDFPHTRQIYLIRNYRSSETILKAAFHIISRNGSHLGTELIPRTPGGEAIRIHEAPTEKAEAEFVLHTIEQMLGGITHFSMDSERVSPGQSEGKYGFGSFAVLYRVNSQSLPLEEALSRSGMPYQVATTSLWRLPAMRKWKALLSLMEDPRRDMEMLYLLPYLPGVGEATVAKIKDLSLTSSVYQTLRTPGLPIHEAARKSLTHFSDCLLAWQDQKAGPLDGLLNLIRQDVPEDWQLEEDGWRALLNAASGARNIWQLLSYMTLEGEELDFAAEKVNLLTLHAAKGLEFPVVFIVGCEDGLLPYRQAGRSLDIEEERRLFYVGITRTRQVLYLVRSKKRTLMGTTRETAPSPYLAEIPDNLMQTITSHWAKKRPKERKSQQMEFF